MKNSAPFGGGLVRSICSYAAISFSHFPKSCSPSAPIARRATATIKKPAIDSKAVRFINTIGNADRKRLQAVTSWARSEDHEPKRPASRRASVLDCGDGVFGVAAF